MYNIRKATLDDVNNIERITKLAFKLYQDELNPDITVDALKENEKDIINDIQNNVVYVAEEQGQLLGSIRYSLISKDIAYIYRFAVDSDINNLGIGTDLLKAVIDDCNLKNITALALHTNTKYFKLARYYYGKDFFVHSTTHDKGYIRALFIKELKQGIPYDISPALKK